MARNHSGTATTDAVPLKITGGPRGAVEITNLDPSVTLRYNVPAVNGPDDWGWVLPGKTKIIRSTGVDIDRVYVKTDSGTADYYVECVMGKYASD